MNENDKVKQGFLHGICSFLYSCFLPFSVSSIFVPCPLREDCSIKLRDLSLWLCFRALSQRGCSPLQPNWGLNSDSSWICISCPDPFLNLRFLELLFQFTLLPFTITSCFHLLYGMDCFLLAYCHSVPFVWIFVFCVCWDLIVFVICIWTL